MPAPAAGLEFVPFGASNFAINARTAHVRVTQRVSGDGVVALRRFLGEEFGQLAATVHDSVTGFDCSRVLGTFLVFS